jgi:ABC-2 type transport system permease protein
MIAYRAIFSARFRTLLQYRAAALAGCVTQLFWGFVRLMIFEAFYRSAGADVVQPMTFAQLACYVWLGQAVLAMQAWNVDPEVRQVIRSGAVAYELLRPLDLYNLWYCRSLALRTAPTLLRCIPICIVAMLLLPLLGASSWALTPPPTLAAAAAFVAAMLGALLLSCAFTMLSNISLLWTLSGDGATVFLSSAVILFSGMVIPLPLFPDWLQPVLQGLPFAGMADTPFRLYTGNIPASQAIPLLFRQLIWTIALILLGRYLLSVGMRRLVIQGG